MRAAVITALTRPEIRDQPEPDPGPRPGPHRRPLRRSRLPDALQTRGEYQLRPQLPFTPGWEVSGVVRDDVGRFRAGDRMAAMPVIGGFAETVNDDSEMVFPLPDEMPLDKGAALPLNYLTGDFTLMRRARLTPGETVLVHGAAGAGLPPASSPPLVASRSSPRPRRATSPVWPVLTRSRRSPAS